MQVNTIQIRILLIFILATLPLAACGGDKAAIDRAKARRIDQETQDAHARRMAEETQRQADWESTRNASNAGTMIQTIVITVTVALCIFLLGIILLYRLWRMLGALEAPAQHWAMLRASQVKLDARTGTFPLLVLKDAIQNPNAGEVYILGAARDADPQQVTADAFVRALGVATRGAAQIGEATKDVQSADAIGMVTGALPLVLKETERSQRSRGR